MRRNEENRADKYIKKHKRFKVWIAFALCLSLLTGTATLYMLNKPATAMTEEGAEKVGLVLETADAEWESGMIEDMNNGEAASGDASEAGDETVDEALEEATEADGEKESDEASETGSDEKEAEDSEQADTDASEKADEESVESAESTSESSDKFSDKETKEEATEKEDSKKAESSNSSDKKTEKKTVVISSTERKDDVVITVLYEDLKGEKLLESKELSISESFNLTEEVRSFEGYKFDKGVIGENQIKTLTKKTGTGTLEKTTVTETVSIDSSEDSSQTKNNESDTANTDAEPSSSENEAGEAETSSNGDAEVSENPENANVSQESSDSAETKSTETEEYTFIYYEATTVSGETIDITENADLHLTYYKPNTKTEFVYDDNEKVTVKAVLTDASALPEGAELTVSEITSETKGYNYDAYMQALNDNAESIADDAGLKEVSEYTDTNTLMYDIAFMYEGKEYQPSEGSVNISIEFKDKQLTSDLSASSEEDITVVHLPIKEEVKEASEITSTQEATDITSDDIEVKTLTEASAKVDGTEKIEFSEESFSIFAVTVYQKHAQGTHDYEHVLGDAINFGIVANNLHIGESQSNFAAANLYGLLQSGNNLTNPVEQTFMAGTVTGEFRVKNNAAYFIVPKEHAGQISHDNKYAIKYDLAYTSDELSTAVGKMLEYGRKASADLAKYDSNIKLEKDGDRDKYDLRNLPAGTYYINLSNVNKFFAKQEPRIYKRSDQNIVFNVTDPSSEIKLYKFFVSTDNGPLIDSAELENDGKYDSINRTIIWNFINADTVHSSGSVVGVFIAGKSNATFYNDSTSAGWLLFPNVFITSGEWHNTNQKMKQISGTAQLQAYKNIDGKAATVSGFTFKLALNYVGGWKELQFITNDEETPHNIIFDTITYGDVAEKAGDSNYQYVKLNVGESQDFIYVIDEVGGTTDNNGNAYTEDNRNYFAKVTVTCERQSNYTDSTYYRVSAPKYYKDFNCTAPIDDELPTFNNTTCNGTVGIKLHKYLNDQDPGDKEFSFKVRALMSNGKLKDLTKEVPLTNVGSNISYSFEYDSSFITLDNSGNKRIYLVITENDITANNAGLTITKDKNYIIARVDLNPDGKSVKNVYYFRLDPTKTEEKGYIDNIESGTASNIIAGVVNEKTIYSKNKIANEEEVAFYNKGSGYLRIHKMVVNDFGSGMVRDDTGTALLSNVVFRITNNASKNYTVFTTFTGHAGRTGTAVEYDGDTHQPTGKTFTVTYNQSAQWTIEGLPIGIYTVDEVADGLTFAYEASSNSSSVVTSNNLSRVTKYDLTVDEEENITKYGTGGNNYREVYSSDLSNHNEFPPTNVEVGGRTQTVQVCNYYSIPVGPISFTKNFSGAVWDSNISFNFKIEALGYTAYTSEKKEVALDSQPMPQGAVAGTLTNVDSKTAILTIKGDDKELVEMIPYKDEQGKQQYTYIYDNAVKDNGNGTYSITAKFSSIPYRYEGTYYYKITEDDLGANGIRYDKSTYYVKIVVDKQYTTFVKYYSYKNMTHPYRNKYAGAYANPIEGSYMNDHEDFYYLAADVTYASSGDFSEDSVIARCSLRLNQNLDTVQLTKNEYNVEFTQGGIDKVVFNNSMVGDLKVRKIWLDSDGNDISGTRSSLIGYVWQRAGDNGQWKQYCSFTLTPESNWSATISDLPLIDENGTAYQYTVKEDEQYYGQFNVSYEYNNATYPASEQGKTDVLEKDVNNGAEAVVSRKNTGYIMTFDGTSRSFGEVTITNKSVYTNTLPSTGGSGTIPYASAGLFIMLAALVNIKRFKATGQKKDREPKTGADSHRI